MADEWVNIPSIITGAVIGVLSAWSGILVQNYYDRREKRQDQIRSRGHHIEELINEYERTACRYWSLPNADQEQARQINALRRRLGSELTALAKNKVKCQQCEILLTTLHRAATLHDNFNTGARQPENTIVLQIQDRANELRHSVRSDLNII